MARVAGPIFLLAAVVLGVAAAHPCDGGALDCVEHLTGSVVSAVQSAALAAGYTDAVQDVDSKWCPNKSYFEFIPVHLGNIEVGKPLTFTNTTCFPGVNTAELQIQDAGFSVTFTNDGHASSMLCSDALMVVTREHTYLHGNGALSGKVQFLNVSSFQKYEQADVTSNGVHLFALPCGLLGTVTSALKTASLFNGTGMEQRNMEFLVERGVFDSMPAAYNTTQHLDESLIPSGSYLAIMRLDGLDPLVMYGTGGRTGHSAVVVHDPRDNIKYVVESTAANPFGKVYWPPPYGIIRTPLSKWIALGEAADYHVNLLPLDPELSPHFDETKFWTWFETVEGMPYGFHTFMQSFLDTADPMKNLPQPIVAESLQFVLEAMDRLLPNSTHGVNVYSLFVQALNNRLNTTCFDLRCVESALDARNMTIAEATAIPEVDGWLYDDGKNYSMVCSEFAAHVYKTAIGSYWPHFEAGEQTPKDNYQWQIYDGKHFTADNCPNGLRTAENGHTFCQLMGEYELPLNGYNSIPIYENINNACSAQWPGYERGPAKC